jgi:hypothetical protein
MSDKTTKKKQCICGQKLSDHSEYCFQKAKIQLIKPSEISCIVVKTGEGGEESSVAIYTKDKRFFSLVVDKTERREIPTEIGNFRYLYFNKK